MERCFSSVGLVVFLALFVGCGPKEKSESPGATDTGAHKTEPSGVPAAPEKKLADVKEPQNLNGFQKGDSEFLNALLSIKTDPKFTSARNLVVTYGEISKSVIWTIGHYGKDVNVPAGHKLLLEEAKKTVAGIAQFGKDGKFIIRTSGIEEKPDEWVMFWSYESGGEKLPTSLVDGRVLYRDFDIRYYRSAANLQDLRQEYAEVIKHSKKLIDERFPR